MMSNATVVVVTKVDGTVDQERLSSDATSFQVHTRLCGLSDAALTPNSWAIEDSSPCPTTLHS